MLEKKKSGSVLRMLPCIRPQKDVLILEVPKKKIKCYDILLYKRENGMLVLHREENGKESR